LTLYLHSVAADTALSFDVVTADGKFKTANAVENKDLFWALKGGGPGDFAVVLSATFKTWNDLPSAGAYMFMNFTMISDPDVYWEGIRIFHDHASRMTSAGLYVYFELGELILRVLPFVAINKSQKELDLLTKPLLDELKAADVPFEYASSEYPTFFDLYMTMFEDEEPKHSLTGGWTFTHEDVEESNDEIVAALRKAVNPREDLMGQGFLVGHFFDAGHTVSKPDSSTHPAFRRSVNLIITTLPVSEGASLEEKADLENLLTNTIDEPLRQLGKNGCAYVNEADPYQDNWQEHFWGSNYKRLFEIKKKWDPKGVFYAIATPGAEEWESIEYGTRLCKPLK
jgi:FAD/FMN-containing dehydrogenase